MKPIYESVDLIPSKGLFLAISPTSASAEHCTELVNLEPFPILGELNTRSGQRAFILRGTSGGSRYESVQDAGNIIVGEITLDEFCYDEQVRSDKPLQIWSSVVSRDLFETDSLPYIKFNPSHYSASWSENPLRCFDSLLFFLQRKQIPITLDFDSKSLNTGNPFLVESFIYAYPLSNIEDPGSQIKGGTRLLSAVFDPANSTTDSALGWIWDRINSADWKWNSPWIAQLFGTNTANNSLSIEIARSFYLQNENTIDNRPVWNAYSFSKPEHWFGNTNILNSYTIISHPGALQFYTIKDGETGKIKRKHYCIGDVVIYRSSVPAQKEQDNNNVDVLVAQENSVGRVGRDIVYFDLRTGVGQENDATAGVEAPLALYKFYPDLTTPLAENLSYPQSIVERFKGAQPNEYGYYQINGPGSVFVPDLGFTEVLNNTTRMTNADENDDFLARVHGWKNFTWGNVNRYMFDPATFNRRTRKMAAEFFSYYFGLAPYGIWGQLSKAGNHDIYDEYYAPDEDILSMCHVTYTKGIWGDTDTPFIMGWTIGTISPSDMYLSSKQKDSRSKRGFPAFHNAFCVNDRKHFVLSNTNNTVQFPDLSKPLLLYNPYTDKLVRDDTSEGESIVISEYESGADVYLWHDVTVRYYPCSGRIKGTKILTHYDRRWKKMNSGSARRVEIDTPREGSPELLLPVAGWSYRFVYEYHDGTFSAPSPVYQAPCLLFSQAQDEDITQISTSYSRPIQYSGDGTETIFPAGFRPQFSRATKSILRCNIYQDGSYIIPTVIDNTPIGRYKFFLRRIFEKIYEPTHPMRFNTNYEQITINNDLEYFRYLDSLSGLFTIVAVYDPSEKHKYEINTPIGEGAMAIWLHMADKDPMQYRWMRLVKVYPTIPLLPGDTDADVNSVFTRKLSNLGSWFRLTYARAGENRTTPIFDTFDRNSNQVVQRQRQYFQWDYLSPEGAFIYTNVYSLLTGARTFPFGNDRDNINSNYYLTYLPWITVQDGISLPHWTYRRALATSRWGAYPWWDTDPRNQSPYISDRIPSPGTTDERDVWGEFDFPRCDVPNSYIQFCFEGPNNSMSSPHITVYNQADFWELASSWEHNPKSFNESPFFSIYNANVLYTHAAFLPPSCTINQRRYWWDPPFGHLDQNARYPLMCGLWNVVDSSKRNGAVANETIYVNVITPLWDRNNCDWYELNTSDTRSIDLSIPNTIPYPCRIPSVLRYIDKQIYRLGNISGSVPQQVRERIFTSGIFPIVLSKSRFTEPNLPTLVSFAGTSTRITYNNQITAAYSALYDSLRPRIIEFNYGEYERNYVLANVPHRKSRWMPIVRGHAISFDPTGGGPRHGFWQFKENWIEDVKYFSGWGNASYYSRDASVPPHWMMFDGAVWHSWNINHIPQLWNARIDANADRAAILNDNNEWIPSKAWETGGNIPIIEALNPRRMPPSTGNWGWPNDYDRTINRKWAIAPFDSSIYMHSASSRDHQHADFLQLDSYPSFPLPYPPYPCGMPIQNFWQYVPLNVFREFKQVYGWSIYMLGRDVRPYFVPERGFMLNNSMLAPSVWGLDNRRQLTILANNNTTNPILGTCEDGKGANPLYPVLQGIGARILSYGITDLWFDPAAAGVTSIDIVLYLPGDRLTLLEQYTSYFTSKMLFDSPRLGLRFDLRVIPHRVKRIHIYRTRHIDDNNWHPQEFGYVSSIDVEWNHIQVDNGKKLSVPANSVNNELYFFDDIPDSRLDFTDDITRFEALEYGLSSTCNAVISERAYYGNFKEIYLPLPASLPRQFVPERPGDWGICRESGVVDVNTTFTSGVLSYLQLPSNTVSWGGIVQMANCKLPPRELYPHNDLADKWTPGNIRVFSITSTDYSKNYSDPWYPPDGVSAPFLHTQISSHAIVDIPNNKTFCIGIYGISHPVDNIERTLIWTYKDGNSSSHEWNAIASIDSNDGGTTLDYGVPPPSVKRNYTDKWNTFFVENLTPSIGEMKIPYAVPIVYNYNSAIRWSDIRNPQVIRGTNIEHIRTGDNDEILALVSTYHGNLLVFKRYSIVRVMFAGGFEIARRDQISETNGLLAPNAWCVYKNNVYFLSQDGFYACDDNKIEKIDIPIAPELLKRISYRIDGIIDPAVYLSTVHLDQSSGIIYINIPAFANEYTPWKDTDGNGIIGVTYCYNPTTGLWWKHQYPAFAFNEYGWIFPPHASYNHNAFLSWSRTMYTDKYNRLWSVPRAPSNWLIGGQVYCMGPHKPGTRWDLGIDDFFEDFIYDPATRSVTDNVIVSPFSDNIRYRQIIGILASPSIDDEITIKKKVRQMSLIAYFDNKPYSNGGLHSNLFDTNDGGAFYTPAIKMQLNMYIYNQQNVASFTGFEKHIQSASWQNQLFRNLADINMIVNTSQIELGGEFTLVPNPQQIAAVNLSRGEAFRVWGTTWGNITIRGWRLTFRPVERFMR